MAKKEDKKTAGRKWFDGQDEKSVITKCEQVWCLGGSDAEAAFFADISTASLSRYLTAHPNIAERRDALRERPILLARTALIEAFDGHTYKAKEKVKLPGGEEKEVEVERTAIKNPDMALKFLERVRKQEFSTRNEIELRDKTMEQLLEEANKKEEPKK